MFFITGDTHRDFNRIKYFCQKYNTTKEDILIILGDVGINFFVGIKDWSIKHSLNKLPITLFSIHGNHEQRPFAINTYQEVEKFGAKAYMEKEFDNLIFAKDGEIYNFDKLQTIVIGGAYSIDKFYRLANKFPWFKDEQPSKEIKKYVEEQLETKNWKIDLVLSHTCPFDYRPIEAFLAGENQNIIDNSTEKWLQTIENKLEYKNWYCGHFHINKKFDKFRFLFEDIIELK